MYKFFKHCKMHGGENITEERLSAIKSSVLSQVNQSEEDKPMKKHFSIKPLIIAAAVSATAVASIATANAATDGAIMNGITKTFMLMINGREVEGEVKITSYATEDGDYRDIELSIPDEALIDGENNDVYVSVDEDGNVKQFDPSEVLSYIAE
ncbi:MAG: hypothetical protein HDT42_07170 [Ruminococcaceae bacterium]|nr:hypothetical protein [Oscillospiraceae bacterium]